MYSNSVWELVDPPKNVKLVEANGFSRKKKGVDGKVETFKVRLVAKRYTQQEGVDYEETFSHVSMLKSIRTLLSIVGVPDYEIWQMDIKTVFLNGYLEESIYIEQPEGFKIYDQKQKVYKLLSPFMDLNKHQGHGILSLMRRSRPMASNKMLMSLV